LHDGYLKKGFGISKAELLSNENIKPTIPTSIFTDEQPAYPAHHPLSQPYSRRCRPMPTRRLATRTLPAHPYPTRVKRTGWFVRIVVASRSCRLNKHHRSGNRPAAAEKKKGLT